MAEKGYWFNASGGVPSYSGAEFVEYFEAFFTQGVRNKDGGALLVTPQSPAAMAVDVAPGIAHGSTGGGGYAIKLDADKTLAISSNSSGSTRIDSIIAEIDILNRAVVVKVLPGTPGSGAPTLTNDADTRHIELARVTIVNGETTITAGEITDVRVSSLPQVDLVGLATVIEDPVFFYYRQLARAN